jgi:hypothetical protein
MQRTIKPRKDSLKSIALDSGKVNQLAVGPDYDRRRVDRVMIEGSTVGSTEVLEVRFSRRGVLLRLVNQIESNLARKVPTKSTYLPLGFEFSAKFTEKMTVINRN